MKMKTIIVEDEANILSETKRNLERMADIEAVSYTHLDVYKRQRRWR